MGNRELSISVCGVVLGVILGAGALAFSNGVSLDASAMQMPMTDTATQASQHSQACDAVKDAAAQMKLALDQAIADNLHNTAPRQILKDAIDRIIAKHCTMQQSSAMSAATSSAASSVAHVDNNCKRFPKLSIRYTQCKLFENLGKVYSR